MLARETLNHFGLALAVLGTALLLVELWLHRRGAGGRLRRSRDAALAVLGLTAALSWWDPLLLPRPSHPPELRWVSVHDSFHYYMGAKYFRELGYTHLYACSAAAELERGRGAEVAQRVYRDLATNRPVTGRSVLGLAPACRERFHPARWKLFVHDVEWFRTRIAFWDTTMQDWGYNATPVWNALGSWLSNRGPVSERQLAWLTLLDVPILWACFGLIAWAFGWRTACVAALFWGTNVANAYAWTGGAILRHAWLLASVAGVCLLRRQKPLAAGASLTLATALSVFPGFLLAGIGARAIGEWVATRRVFLSREHRQLLLGAVLTLAVLLPAALPSGGTPAAWGAFIENSRLDSEPSPNSMGLPALLSYDEETRLRHLWLVAPGNASQEWSEARKQTLAERWPLWAALLAGWLWLAVGAARRQPDWVAALVGLGFVVFAFQLSCYYYAFMLLFGLLWPRHRSLGIALCGVAAASLWLGQRWLDDEDLYARLGFLAVAFTGYAILVLRFARSENATSA